jgi:hypothetical protein
MNDTRRAALSRPPACRAPPQSVPIDNST